MDPTSRSAAATDSDTDLVETVLWDRRSAVSLMQHLSRYGSFLVEPDRHRWLVFARCPDEGVRAELIARIESWASTYDRSVG